MIDHELWFKTFATAAVRVGTPSFSKTCSKCLLMVLGLELRIIPISLLVLPLEIHIKISDSRGVRPKAVFNECMSHSDEFF
jgi:hypothetical protein